MGRERLLHIDIIRIVSCYFVIFNHSSSKGYTLFYSYPPGSFRFLVYLFFSVLSKLSVPEFFSLSGSVLLCQQKLSFLEELKFRFSKILTSLIPFSFMYELLRARRENRSFSIKLYLIHMWGAGPEFHLWFLYGYLYYLLCLPFLRHLAQHLSGREALYLAGLTVLFHGLWPMLEYLLGPSSLTLFGTEQSLWLIMNIWICPCVGYVIEQTVNYDQVGITHLSVITTMAILCMGFVEALTVYQFTKENDGRGHPELFYRRFSMLNAWCLHLNVKYLFRKVSLPAIWQNTIHSVAKATFGIYLFHLMLLRLRWMELVYEAVLSTGLNYMIAGNVHCVIVMTIAYIITAICSKIPILKRVVGY